jgi:hypothetical protein
MNNKRNLQTHARTLIGECLVDFWGHECQRARERERDRHSIWTYLNLGWNHLTRWRWTQESIFTTPTAGAAEAPELQGIVCHTWPAKNQIRLLESLGFGVILMCFDIHHRGELWGIGANMKIYKCIDRDVNRYWYYSISIYPYLSICLSISLFVYLLIGVSLYWCISLLVYLFVGVSLCLCISLFVYLLICVSLYLCISLFVYIFICVSLYLCISLFVYLFVCVALYLCISLFVYLFFYLFVCLSVCLSICLSIYLSISLYLSLSLFLSFSLSLFISLSLYLFVNMLTMFYFEGPLEHIEHIQGLEGPGSHSDLPSAVISVGSLGPSIWTSPHHHGPGTWI